MTAKEHRKMLEMDFEQIPLEELVDVGSLRIDKSLSLEDRKKQYIKKTHNPYMQRRKSIKIKISFANNGVSIEQAFENMLLMT